MNENKARFKTIRPGIILCRSAAGKRTVRYSVMVNRKRFTMTSKLPLDVLLDPATGRPTRHMLVEYSKFCEQSAVTAGGPKRDAAMREPTLAELAKVYEEIAWKRHADPNYGRPGARAIDSALKNYGYCVEASGLRPGCPYSELCTPEMSRRIFLHFRDVKHLSGVTAATYVKSIQSVTAHWTIMEYRDRGYDVRPVTVPDLGVTSKAKTYERLSEETKAKIEAWYVSLGESEDRAVRLCAALIYNLAIRPSDIATLTRANFPSVGRRRRLVYTPHKTRDSSGRRVDIEIPEALFDQIRELAGERFEAGETLVNSAREAFNRLNRSLRAAADMPKETWSKAAYELRKLCLDTIMLRQGIDQAVKLSGDRRETIEHFYVDPYKGTQPLVLVAPSGR